MNEDRVKDPLGHYEELRAKAGPDTTWVGLKLLLMVPLGIAGLVAVAWAFRSLFRSLFA